MATALDQYAPLAMLLVIAGGLGVVLVVMSSLFGPKRPNAAKVSPFECGMEPVGNARTRFPVRYYLVALVFVVFDIEAVFIYPWAASFVGLRGEGPKPSALGVFAFWEMITFMGILLVGYVYLWRRGALDWE